MANRTIQDLKPVSIKFEVNQREFYLLRSIVKCALLGEDSLSRADLLAELMNKLDDAADKIGD